MIGSGLGDMVGFVLLKKRTDTKIANRFSRRFAVWYRTWDQTVVLGEGWREATQDVLTNRQAYELGRLINRAQAEKKKAVATPGDLLWTGNQRTENHPGKDVS